jgi:hypothetical protein
VKLFKNKFNLSRLLAMTALVAAFTHASALTQANEATVRAGAVTATVELDSISRVYNKNKQPVYNTRMRMQGLTPKPVEFLIGVQGCAQGRGIIYLAPALNATSETLEEHPWQADSNLMPSGVAKNVCMTALLRFPK